MQAQVRLSNPEHAPPRTYQHLAIGVAWAIVLFLLSSIARMGNGRLELDSLITPDAKSLVLFLSIFWGLPGLSGQSGTTTKDGRYLSSEPSQTP
jgi:hypothetical protein